MTTKPEVPGGSEPLQEWRDRVGRLHPERRATPHLREPEARRVEGPLEKAWAKSGDAETLIREMLARPNPVIEPDPEDASSTLWTWSVEDATARAILLWTNPIFDHQDVRRMEFSRLPGSDLWTICLQLPASLRASYRIAAWREEGEPPWRTASGRRDVILAAMEVSEVDARGLDTVCGSRGEVSSVGAGPLAPVELWRGLDLARRVDSRTDELDLPGDERAWVYSPGSNATAATPLLVLFDGQVWNRMGLPALLDAAIAEGILPPLHVAMLDSREQQHRWSALGVPCGQVDTVIDHLLPRVRANWDVDPRGEATLVSGQSLGGIASLWTLALAEGEVQHAIAQSASLWRFDRSDIAEALLSEPSWRSIELQAGTFEGDMLADARDLEADLRDDPRLGDRVVRSVGFEAGHDWAAWRANLLPALATPVV